jgi:hypothetical protein
LPRPSARTDEQKGASKREADSRRQRVIAEATREIGEIPRIANVRRRSKARQHPVPFVQTYLQPAFPLPCAPHHLDEFERMMEAADQGLLYALADPRGDGKTTRVRGFALWAIANGVVDYTLIVGANLDKGVEAIETLKLWMRYAPEFGEDYPEISVAVRALRGIANRASGQVCIGESTLIGWGQERITLPTVPPPPNWPKAWPLRSDGMVPTAGAIIGATGLTGEGIRGSVITTSTGEMLRPKLVLPDDPQTDESSRSKAQNVTRKRLLNSTLLGLAGPDQKMAVVMPCTVIARGDAIDEILDRKLNPLWRGTRRGILLSMPTNLKAWEEYFKVYDACALAEPPDFGPANAYYLSHRETLDAGAAAAWEYRKKEDEVSAIQHAMHLYHRDKWAFWSEYMNQPLDEQSGEISRKLDAKKVGTRLTGLPRLTVPIEATRITAFIDCGKSLLWYSVVAWDERFNGWVLDYGAWPGQPVGYYTKENPARSLADLFPDHTDEQLLYAALRDLSAHLFGRTYPRHGTGEVRTIDLCLVDEGYLDKVVYQFCRESTHAANLMPSKGHVPKTLGATPMSRWQARTGERAAKPGQPSWRVGPVGSGKGRHCIFEANEWKSHVATLLTTPAGGGGCLRLFGDDGTDHRLIGDHCTAEFSVPIRSESGRLSERWEAKPAQDNDLWDTLVGAAVAAGTLKIEWHAADRMGEPVTEPAKPTPLRYDPNRARAPATVPAGGAKPLRYADRQTQRTGGR